jgi:phosphinothricin acetyltransferase
LSAYRPGRAALRYTAEISIYLDERHHHRGIGTALIRHAVSACPPLGIRNVIGVVIDRNLNSQKLLEKMGFQRWGHLPRVLDFDGEELGEYYYGLRVDQS